MKRQLTILMAVLLSCTAAIALTTWPGLQAFTYVTATFVVAPQGAGKVNPTTAKVLKGSQTSNITATANAGYSFEGWYDGETLLSTENPHQFTLNNNITITAKFKAEAANTILGFIKSGCEGMGTVAIDPIGTAVDGGYQYNHGTEVSVTATANKGYKFEKWVDGNDATLSTEASYTFTVDADKTVYAVFSPLENYNADLISFPGAEGYGRFTTGGRAVDGRGSKVYYVTRLDDCADNNLVEGTFRWAVKTGDDTPRTILFKVAGTIYLTSKLTGLKPNLTIAGQTAPGGGICLAGYQMKLPSNSIVRHIRFRAGDLPKTSMSQLDVENISNVILDHCTFAWSMEENLTMYDCDYTTVQWCLFSEPLYDSRNSKGNRAYGAQWGGEHGTMHHCLFAHCVSRSPRFNGVRANVNDRQVDAEFINNVIYNWGNHNSVYGGECSAGGATDYNRTYMINNYYRPGPATQVGTNNGRHFVRPTGGSINEVGEWYLSGNMFETGSKWRGSANFWNDEILEKVNADNYWGFLTEKGRGIHFWSLNPSQELYDEKLLKSLPEGYQLTMSYETAYEAYEKVVQQAGASLPRYDENDARILKEAAGEIDPQFGGALGVKLGVIDSPYDITLQDHDEFAALYEGDESVDNKEIEVTCYPRLQPTEEDFAEQVVDTDGDGLPDAYEIEKGLDPNNPADGMSLSASGYSNLELYLNGVADREIDAKVYTEHQPAIGSFSINATVGEGEQYTTIQAAIDAAPTDGTPYYIYIKDGVYENHVQIDKANIHLVGQSRENTIISWNKTNADGGGVDKAATINVTANDVSFDNLTIRNTRIDEGQALALYTKADRIVITNCNLEGWQDTYRTGKDGQRHLIRNSKFTGTTDFIYGAGEAYFDGCTLQVLRSSNVIVAPDHSTPNYGYVFQNCTIEGPSVAASRGMTTTATAVSTHLGRPWGNTPKVAFINTQLDEGVTIPAEGWQEMEGKPIQMAEYNTMDASGNAVDLSDRRTSFGGTASKAVLSKTEAVNSYKLDYMLRGADNWDADWQAFILPAPKLSKSGTTLSWTDETGFATNFLVIKNGVATITTDTSCEYSADITVQSISAFGVTGEMAKASEVTAISTITTSGAAVAKRQYFTTDGRQVNRLQHGVTIIRETLTDNTTRTVKVISK